MNGRLPVVREQEQSSAALLASTLQLKSDIAADLTALDSEVEALQTETGQYNPVESLFLGQVRRPGSPSSGAGSRRLQLVSLLFAPFVALIHQVPPTPAQTRGARRILGQTPSRTAPPPSTGYQVALLLTFP